LKNKVKKILDKLKIKNGDHLILHGNLALISQIKSSKSIDLKLKFFIDQLKKKIGKNGVVFIPAFTYSFCKKKKFNINNTKSEIGLFSELIRKFYNNRTHHPIFSFTVIGKKKGYSKVSLKSCFGKNSFFDNFKKNNGKIICLGSGFSSITFLHHIEEFCKVNYREYRLFSGNIFLTKNKKRKISTNYFVRKNKKIKNNFLRFERYLRKKIQYSNFERFNIITINSKILFKEGVKVLKKNPYYFI